MLTISRRDARIGRNLPFRTEDHGDDHVKACDIPIEGLTLDACELDALLGAGSHARLFKAPSAEALTAGAPPSTLLEPAFRKVPTMRLKDRIDSATVYVWLGEDDRALNLGPCRLKNLVIEPKVGGLTELTFTARAKPALDRSLAVLIDGMAEVISIEIAYEHNAEQAQLPMSAETPTDDEDDDDDEDAPTTRRGRRGGSQRKGNGEPRPHEGA